MTGKDHINIARALIEAGKVDQAQVEVLISMADSLDDLNDRVHQLEDTVIFQLSNLAERVEKCLVLNQGAKATQT